MAPCWFFCSPLSKNSKTFKILSHSIHTVLILPWDLVCPFSKTPLCGSYNGLVSNGKVHLPPHRHLIMEENGIVSTSPSLLSLYPYFCLHSWWFSWWWRLTKDLEVDIIRLQFSSNRQGSWADLSKDWRPDSMPLVIMSWNWRRFVLWKKVLLTIWILSNWERFMVRLSNKWNFLAKMKKLWKWNVSNQPWKEGVKNFMFLNKSN